MTLSPAEAHLWHKDYPMFFQWVFRLWARQRDTVFQAREADSEDDYSGYDLVSKLYVLMKRLHQSYDAVMQMQPDDRDTLFAMEMKLIREEAKAKAEAKKKL